MKDEQLRKNLDLAILGIFVLTKFILQYSLIDKGYDLHRDEYLHLDQANHLDWGYASIPPFTSWVSYIISLLGNGVFWVKFFPALFGALTIVFVWKTIEVLKGGLLAKVLGASGILFSIILRINTLYQPNSFDILCWTAVSFFIVKYLLEEKPSSLYWAAIFFGVGFLNKYNMIYLAMGLVPAVLVTRNRAMLLRKEVYVAVAIAFLIVLPNLIWQYVNDFPVFFHLKELAEKQLVNVRRTDFIMGQIFFFAGSLAVMIASLVALLFYKPMEKLRPFFWSFIIILAIYTYFKAKDYYAIGLYPVYIAIGSTYLCTLLRKPWGKIIIWLLILSPLGGFIFMKTFLFPDKTPEYMMAHQDRYKKMGMLRWEDGKDHHLPQDFADMLGWSELAKKVDEAYRRVNKPDETLVLCDNYGQAGAINYYSNEDYEAVSFNADYLHWFDLSKKYKHVIRVKETGDDNDRRKEIEETSPYFESYEVADSITNVYAREHGTTIFIFRGAKMDINARIEQEVNEILSAR